MDTKRSFNFKRFVLASLNFNPQNIKGSIEYQINTTVETNEDNANEIRLGASIVLRDAENKSGFFTGEIKGVFTKSVDFGEFKLDGIEEKAMLQLVFDELSNVIYELTAKAFELPMKINFSSENLQFDTQETH